jgi:hypothetical protein
VFFSQLRVNVMVGLSPAIETVLDERAKHAVLLIDAVEESANVTMLA